MISNLTAFDIITQALERLGVISYGESIDPAISKTSLQTLNAVRAELSLSLSNYKKYDQVYTTSANKQFITLGSSSTVSGDILERPAVIDQVSVIYGSDIINCINKKLKIYTYEEYREKAITNIYQLPTSVFIDTSYPLQYLYFYPGIAAGYSIRVLGYSYPSDYENITDTLIDPPEWFELLSIALALRLSYKFGVDQNTTQGLVAQYSSISSKIKDVNFNRRIKATKSDLFGNNGFNILTGGM